MRMPDVLSELSTLSLGEISRLVEGNRLPPVDQWHPQFCGDSEMRIARDGTWFHQGNPIARPQLVRLFSRILRREADGRYMLVTPGEMLEIAVEDTPFLAIEMKSEGDHADRRIAFRLNVGDPLVVGPANPIRVEDRDNGPHPTVTVRRGLEARIDRPLFYELAALALEEGTEPPGLWSNGAFFRLDGGP